MTRRLTRGCAQLRCGWSFRGIFAASKRAIRKHPPSFYAQLEEQLGAAVFPVAGMYMERLWRRVLLCARAEQAWEARGAGEARAMLRERRERPP